MIKSNRSIILFIFITILCFCFVPAGDTHALMDSSNNASLPTLKTFIQQVKNGQADELRGIYIADILADRVVQQPAGNNEFVSPWENVITQFSLPSSLGSTGLMAHNYLAGRSFAFLRQGQEIDLIYGDGHVSTFVVSEVLQYQAFDSASTASSFMNLNNKSIRTSTELFTEVYDRSGMLILQTCIEAHNNPTWGRLFIVARPVTE